MYSLKYLNIRTFRFQVKYDNGWNISHIRGALQSLAALASQHPEVMSNLVGMFMFITRV